MKFIDNNNNNNNNVVCSDSSISGPDVKSSDGSGTDRLMCSESRGSCEDSLQMCFLKCRRVSTFGPTEPKIFLPSCVAAAAGYSGLFQTSLSPGFQLLLEDPEAFPGQMGCVILPAGSGSTAGSLPTWTCFQEASPSDARTPSAGSV